MYPKPLAVRPAPRLPVAGGSPIARQDAAVRRLAAWGLPIYCGGSQRPMVALTFDDGPGVYTHYLLKKLRQYHLRATFFLVGKSIRAWPGWAQREKPFGAFGDHTLTHPDLVALPLAQAEEEIAGQQALEERTVREPVVLFRPPYGTHNRAIDAEIRRLGMAEILWDVDSQDSLGASYRGIERNVLAGLRPGNIILMHENHGQTIRALDTIFMAVHRRHLQAVTVPQLLAADPPTLGMLRRGFAGCPVTPGSRRGAD
jgi:peptidoglycan/xylan/chitin deacetylase (PgdA/CDA1 family)